MLTVPPHSLPLLVGWAISSLVPYRTLRQSLQYQGCLLPYCLIVLLWQIVVSLRLGLHLIYFCTCSFKYSVWQIVGAQQIFEEGKCINFYYLLWKLYLFISFWLCWVFIAVWGLSCPHGMWDLSSLIRDWTHIPCLARQILNHWTTSKVLVTLFSGTSHFYFGIGITSHLF